MSTRRGPPKHQNEYRWKPNAGRKINETEVGGKFKPLSEITGVCSRCKEQIDWKRRYGKYKTLTEPAKCQSCAKRNVRQAYHNLCAGCSKAQKVCAKCRCRVNQTVGRDIEEIEAEQKMLEEAIKHARERERRSLLRAMNKDKCKSSERMLKASEQRVGDLFPETTLEEYAMSGKSDKIDSPGLTELCEVDDDVIDPNADANNSKSKGESNTLENDAEIGEEVDSQSES